LQPGFTGAVQLHLNIIKDPEALHPADGLSTQSNDLVQRPSLKDRLENAMDKGLSGLGSTMDCDHVDFHGIVADIVDLQRQTDGSRI
jgi:hypothetical protein